MLKRIENAELFCIYRDVYVVYDDGKTFEQHDPRIHRWLRRNRKAEKISVKFTIGLTIGKRTSTVPAVDPEKPQIIPIKDSSLKIDEILRIKADQLLREAVMDDAMHEPVCFMHNGNTMNEVYWLYGDKFYKDSENLEADEVKALILARDRMRKARINRAKTIANTAELPIREMRRGFIPEDIRLLVWERDCGKCTKCGSTSELQFDHIIPFSLGGGSTQDNLQILCGPCNRLKSNSIA